jgi:DNA-binding SARP family transcriptional activator/TolB-like protein
MPKTTQERDGAASSLEIHLLGPFRVAVNGAFVEDRHWSRRKPKLLLKLLALQPHHQLHREQAMELLWPDADPEAATNNLHKAIHMVRRALEPALKSVAQSHFILTQGQQIILRASERLWIDLEDFEQTAAAAIKSADVEAYEAALALYKSDLLTEDLYEDWAATRRELARSIYQELLAKLAQQYESRGELKKAIERLKELAVCDSSNEEIHRQLMRLYALTGNKHQALRQYQVCCEALQSELDAEPERSTRKLLEQIISGSLEPLSPATKSEHDSGSGKAIDSLAILPLINATADEGAEYFSDGITESIINSLSQLPQLKVMARSTVFRYKGLEIDPQEVGNRLGVRAVLTGRVSYRDDTLNIQTELVDVADGSQLWGERYKRSSSDIFEVQEEIAREIAEKLRLTVTRDDKSRLTRRHTDNPEAYQLYLKGSYFWNKRTLDGVTKSIEHFRQAIELDPRYALAYTGVANAYAKLGDVGLTALPPKEAFSKSKSAAMRALEIDDTLAEAHTSLAHVHMHGYEWLKAETEFSRAIELNPNYATAHHWYAYYQIMSGRVDKAMTEIARALALDPLSLPINTDFGEILYFARQYDRALEQFETTLEMDPYYYQAHLVLARVYEQKGMFEESITEFFRARELSSDSADALASLGHAYATSGKIREARAVLAELKELSQSKYVSPYDIALIHVGLDEKDMAFEGLRLAYDEHAEWGIYLNIDPRLDPLRSDARFSELVRRAGLHNARN